MILSFAHIFLQAQHHVSWEVQNTHVQLDIFAMTHPTRSTLDTADQFAVNVSIADVLS